jgi:hypothetical protein
MNPLIIILIINSVGILIIYLSYRLFSWLLIKRDPFLYSIEKDQFLHKPNLFTGENKELAKNDLKDQHKFTLTEVSKML